jgi:predicted CXXCH cytochrome family protein
MAKGESILLFVIFSSILLLPPALRSQSDEDCLVCHGDPELKSESGKPLFVDSERYAGSAHGQAGITCVDCHMDLRGVKDFPHASPLQAVNCSQCHETAGLEFEKSVHFVMSERRGSTLSVGCKDCHGTHDIRASDDFDSSVFALNLPATCEKCHLEKVPTKKEPDFILKYRQSVHYQALEKFGLTMSADCSNCHGAHDIRDVSDPLSLVSRKNIIHTCGTCHVGIERDYLEGVHGKDYVKGIEDVPICTDCHSEHDIASPQSLNSKVYATKVAAVCSRCHDNLALAHRYGMLASRLETYNETFHGTASRYGETRVANCASCHGFHDIRPSSDPKSSINPENLAKTCGKCHPGASRHFAESPIHVMPGTVTATKYRFSYYIKNIYIVAITAIISVFLIFIAADLFRRIVRKRKHG